MPAAATIKTATTAARTERSAVQAQRSNSSARHDIATAKPLDMRLRRHPAKLCLPIAHCRS
jgi:hypothetical protein